MPDAIICHNAAVIHTECPGMLADVEVNRKIEVPAIRSLRWLLAATAFLASSLANAQVRCAKCLASVQTMSTAVPASSASTGSSTSSCQKIVDRYRGLAAYQPGTPPIDVLDNAPASGLKRGGEIVGYVSGPSDAQRSTRKSNLPFQLDESLASTEGGDVQQLPGQNYYWIHKIEGTAHCNASSWLTVRNGVAHATDPPLLEDDPGEGGFCQQDLGFGTLDGTPIFISSDSTVGMTVIVKVATWASDGFTNQCSVKFSYVPRFSSRTRNAWKTGCHGRDCAGLKLAAVELAKAVHAGPAAAREHYTRTLSEKRREQFKGTAAMPEKPKEAEVPSYVPTVEQPVRLPYILGQHLYIASIGRFTIGWRIFDDWRVEFEGIGVPSEVPEEAVFSVGMARGALADTEISEIR